MSRTAVIFQSHIWSAIHALRYERLRSDLGSRADCYLMFDGSADEDTRAAVSEYAEARLFKAADLQKSLGYSFFSERGLVPGSQHFPLLEFSRQTDYTRYWLIECDVEFSGNWASLLDRTFESDADLICSHLHPCSTAPHESLWRSLAAPGALGLGPPLDWAYSAFLPVSRFTARALRAVDRAHQDGWRGHSEVLIPSVMSQAKFEMADLRNFGPLYLSPSRNPVTRKPYHGSLRWRPEVSANEFVMQGVPNTIFHPVKQAWTWSPQGLTRETNGQLKLLPQARLKNTARE